jgi:hypothetical protein
VNRREVLKSALGVSAIWTSSRILSAQQSGRLSVVDGGGAGRMKLGGRHIVLPERTSIANLHLTLLQKVGIERDKFGDSTGTIPGV